MFATKSRSSLKGNRNERQTRFSGTRTSSLDYDEGHMERGNGGAKKDKEDVQRTLRLEPKQVWPQSP